MERSPHRRKVAKIKVRKDTNTQEAMRPVINMERNGERNRVAAVENTIILITDATK